MVSAQVNSSPQLLQVTSVRWSVHPVRPFAAQALAAANLDKASLKNCSSLRPLSAHFQHCLTFPVLLKISLQGFLPKEYLDMTLLQTFFL